ncbi:MAG: aldolase/citrate lyase family protein, partial [Bacteroidota bacterium]
MRLLDSGAYGMICPMINTKKECEKFVGACLYPPMGYRSFGPTRQRIYAGLDYGNHANEETLILAMIETKEAVENIDEIASVEGLDGIFVGSGDLKLSLTGKAGHGNTSDLFDEAIGKILASCERHNIVPGIWCSSVEMAKQQQAKGYRFIALKSDSMMLNEYAIKLAEDLNREVKSETVPK